MSRLFKTLNTVNIQINELFEISNLLQDSAKRLSFKVFKNIWKTLGSSAASYYTDHAKHLPDGSVLFRISKYKSLLSS